MTTATTLTLIQNRRAIHYQDTWAVRMLFRELVWVSEDFQAFSPAAADV